MILYPTETIYGIGVHALDDVQLAKLFALKGRDESQTVSWLVRNIDDIHTYAEVSKTAAEIAKRFLPGPLTLVLPAKDTVPDSRQGPDGTIGLRISSDKYAQQVIERFWAKHQAPLTCTSANVSGLPALATPELIIEQFKETHKDTVSFSEIIDDGPRMNPASTVVSIVGDEVTLLREGTVPFVEIKAYL